MAAAHRTHKWIAGAGMVLAPLFLLISGIIQPTLKSNELEQLLVIRANLNDWYASQAFALAALAAAVPAVLGLMHMLRERQWATGAVGGGLALLGIVFSAGTVALSLVQWEMMRFGLPVPITAAVVHDLKSTAGMQIPFIVLPFAFALGMAILAVGLGVSRATNPVVAFLVGVGALCIPIAYAISSVTLLIIGAAVLLVGLGAVGMFVLRESETEWEHTPEFHGFRAAGPAAGA